jgi:hypothetical protein
MVQVESQYKPITSHVKSECKEFSGRDSHDPMMYMEAQYHPIRTHVKSEGKNLAGLDSHDPMLQMAAHYQPIRSPVETDGKEFAGQDSDQTDNAKSRGEQNMQVLKCALNHPTLVTQPWFWAQRMQHGDKRSADQARLLDTDKNNDCGSSKSSSPIDSYMQQKKLKMECRSLNDTQWNEKNSTEQFRVRSGHCLMPHNGSIMNNYSRERKGSTFQPGHNSLVDGIQPGAAVNDLINKTANVDQVQLSPPLRFPVNDVLQEFDQMKRKMVPSLYPVSFQQKTLGSPEKETLKKANLKLDVYEKNNIHTNGYLSAKQLKRNEESSHTNTKENSPEKETKKSKKWLSSSLAPQNNVCGRLGYPSSTLAPPHTAHLEMEGFHHMHPALMFQYNHYAAMQQQFAQQQKLQMSQAQTNGKYKFANTLGAT